MDEPDCSAFACPNPDRSAYGRRGLDTIRPHGWSSKARGLRCLRCTRCGKSFSERPGSPLFRTRLPPGKATQLAEQVIPNGLTPPAGGVAARPATFPGGRR